MDTASDVLKPFTLLGNLVYWTHTLTVQKHLGNVTVINDMNG